jgi:cellulose synthase/poly-beta-1,6-N-acetylglucosamine synthase-like glycosyltransferase
MAKWAGRPVRKRPIEPSVTVVIAAHNEAGSIEQTVRNKLEQDYPREKLNVIVVSDESSDGTDRIVSGIGARVRLIRQEPRQGKTAAINLAVKAVDAELIVFSDANSMYAPDAVRKLAQNFADPSVGYVTGKMIYVNEDGSIVGDGCSAYMRYENFLREQETLVGSVVGVDGGIDAVRRALFREMRPDQQPDFVLPLSIVGSTSRVVYEAEALLRENSLSEHSQEYRMRVRVALRALWALWDMRYLLNPLRYGIRSLQILSHKVLRYLAFIPMAAAFAANVWLAPAHVVYAALLCLQAACYLGAALGWVMGDRGGRLLSIPYYFLLLNVSAGHAALLFLKGERRALWTPRVG